MSITQISDIISASANLKAQLAEDKNCLDAIDQSVKIICECFKTDGKLLLCGNGGSASDAQHIAAELSGRFYKDRAPLFAEALHNNTSYITAVANDYSYDHIYSRMIEAKGRKGDCLIAISTSGNSKNILEAVKKAKERQLTIIGLTGESVGLIDPFCDRLIKIPSKDTPRIQECHILVGHILCELIESNLFD